MRIYFLIAFICFLTIPAITLSGELIPEGALCAECGMRVDPGSRFSACAVDQDGRKFFCDIGDMFHYYRKDRGRIKDARVRDFLSGEWIDARNAFYVKSDSFRSPMSWKIGAFKNRSDVERYGSPFDFDHVFELLK